MPNIDENVVKMSFDNKQFEQGVAESLKSIEDLKKALKFDKMSDSLQGLENISNAMSSTLDDLSNSAERVARTFSPLGKIVNKTLDELTGPIAQQIAELTKWSTGFAGLGAGGKKYEDYTKSVQTITNATGKSVEEVSKSLDVLMKYTDETSYDFSEMVKSIGKFTSVGIELERAEAAMEGIANWAAKSGAGKQEANRAMYNISQAMGSGALKLIDWKSIENANMATKEFKEMAIQTAIELGVLQDMGDGVGAIVTIDEEKIQEAQEALNKAMISSSTNRAEKIAAAEERYAKAQQKAVKETIVSYQNFNDTLQSKWLTSDVLTAVLEKYADTSTEFGLSAFKAAQEALTFTDAIDALKDAISSGWMKTMELLFGNLDEARVMWTNVANGLIEFVDVLTGWRNELLQGWHDLGGYNVMVEAASNVWQTFMNIVIGVKEALENIFPPMTANNLLAFTNKLKDASDNLLKAFGIDTISTFEEEIEVTVDYAEKLNKLLQTGDKSEAVYELQQELVRTGYLTDKNVANGIFGPETKKAVEALQKSLGVDVTGSWDAATRQAAILKKKFVEIEKEIHEFEYTNTEEVVEKYYETVNYAEKINKLMKRGDQGDKVAMLQKRLIKMGYLLDGAEASGIYGPKTEAAVKKLQEALGVEVNGEWDYSTRQAAKTSDGFQEIIEKERTVKKDTEGLTGPMAHIQSIVEGIASAVKIVADIFTGAAKIVMGVLHIFDPLLDVVTRIASAFSGMFVTMSDQMQEGEVVDGWVSRLTGLLQPLAGLIEGVANALHGFLDEYAYFLYDYDLENSFANFFNFILYNLKNNTILGPVIHVVESVAEKVMWLANIITTVLGGVFIWISDQIGGLFGNGFGKTGPVKENGLVVTLIKIFYTIQTIVGMIVGFLYQAFSSLFGFDKAMVDPNKSQTAVVLDGFLSVVTTVAQGLLLGVTLIGYALRTILGYSAKYVLPIVSAFAPMFSMISGDIKSGQVKNLSTLLISFWAAFGSTEAGKFVQKGIDNVKKFFDNVKLYLQEKFPGVMKAFSDAWGGLKVFFSWDADKTVLDNLKDKFEMLKTGVINAVTTLKNKLLEFKDYLIFLFSKNEATGHLNLFDELPKLLMLFQPVVDLFIKVKDKFKQAWSDFVGVTKDGDPVAEIEHQETVLDVIRNFFGKFASVDWGKMIKPAIYALAGYTVYNGIKSIRNLTDTISDRGVMGVLFGSGKDDGEDGVADKAMKIAKSALILAGAIGLLAIIPADKAAAGVAVLTVLVGVITGVSALFKKFELDKSGFADTLTKVGSAFANIAKSLVYLAAGIWLLMGIVKGLSNSENIGPFIGSLAIIAGFIVGLAAVEIAVSKLGGKKGKNLDGSLVFEMCKGVLVLVLSMKLMMDAIKGQDIGLIIGSVLLITLFLAELGGIEILLSKFGTKGEKKVSGVLEMCVGLMLVVQAFSNLLGILRKIPAGKNDRVLETFAYIETFLLTLGAIVVLLGAFGKDKFGSSLGIAAEIGVMMYGFTKVIEGFANAITKVRGTDPGIIQWFAAGLVGGLAVLGTLMVVLGALGWQVALTGALGLAAFLGIIIGAIEIVGEVSNNLLNKFGSTLRLFGDRMVMLSNSTSAIDFDSLDKMMNWLKDTLIPTMTQLAGAKGYFDKGLEAARSLFRVGLELKDYVSTLQIVGETGIQSSIIALLVVQLAQEIANAAAQVNVPDDLLEGKLSLLGSHLLLYSTMLSEVTADNKSGEALQMVQDAKDIADAISAITFDDAVAKRLVLIGAALKLYYQELANVGKTDENGNPVETKLMADDVTIDPENIKKIFQALADAVPQDVATKVSAYQENGDVDLISVGLGIEALGTALESYATNIGKFTDNSVKNANDTLDKIKDIDEYIQKPKVAEAGQYLTNNKSNISSFAANIVVLGAALWNYSFFIGNLNKDKVQAANDVLDKTMDISQKLAGKTDGILDGIISFFAGKENQVTTSQIVAFKENVESLGVGIRGYYEAINGDGTSENPGVDLDMLKDANGVLDEIIKLANEIPHIGAIGKLFNGEQNLGDFSDGIAKLGLNLQEFSNYVSGMAFDKSTGKFAQQFAAVSETNLDPALDLMERIMGWGNKFFDDNYTDAADPGAWQKFEIVAESISKTIKTLAALGTETVGGNWLNREAAVPIFEALASVGTKMTKSIANSIMNAEEIDDVISNGIKQAIYVGANRVKTAQDSGSELVYTSSLKAIGLELINQIAAGMEDETAQDRFEKAIENLLGKVSESAKKFYETFVGIGAYLDMGIIEGVTKYSALVAQVMRMMALGAIVGPVIQETQVASPSRKFEWIAQMCALGLKNGFDRYSYLVKDSSMDFANSSITSIAAAFNNKKTNAIALGSLDTMRELLLKAKGKDMTDFVKQILVVSGYLKEIDTKNIDKVREAVVEFKKEVLGYDDKDITTGWSHNDSLNLYRSARDSLGDNIKYTKLDYEKEMVEALGIAYKDTSENIREMVKSEKKLTKSSTIKDRLLNIDPSKYGKFEKRVTKELLVLSGYLDNNDIHNQGKITDAIGRFQTEQMGKESRTNWTTSDAEMLYYLAMNNVSKDTDVSGLKYGNNIMRDFAKNTNKGDKAQKKLNKTTQKTVKQQKKLNKTYKELQDLAAKRGWMQGNRGLKYEDPTNPLNSITGPLKLGDKGDQVKALQKYLNETLKPYLKKPLDVNGIYDEATQKAVMKLQKGLGLDQFGEFDEKTLEKAEERESNKAYLDRKDKEYEDELKRSALVRQERTEAALKIQNFLNKHGFLQEGSYQLGVMDSITESALKAFNEALGLDYKVDPQLWGEKQYEKWKKDISSKVSDKDIPKIKPDDEDYINYLSEQAAITSQKREDVLALQRILEWYGFLTEKDYTPGVYNAATKKAEKQFNKWIYGSENPDEKTRAKVDKMIEDNFGSFNEYVNTPIDVRKEILFGSADKYDKSSKARKSTKGKLVNRGYLTNSQNKTAQLNRLYREIYGYDYDSSEGLHRVSRWNHATSDATLVQAMQEEMIKRGFMPATGLRDGSVDQQTVDAFALFKQALFGYKEAKVSNKIEFTSSELRMLDELFNTYGSWDAIWKHLGYGGGKGFKYESWMPSDVDNGLGAGWKNFDLSETVLGDNFTEQVGKITDDIQTQLGSGIAGGLLGSIDKAKDLASKVMSGELSLNDLSNLDLISGENGVGAALDEAGETVEGASDLGFNDLLKNFFTTSDEDKEEIKEDSKDNVDNMVDGMVEAALNPDNLSQANFAGETIANAANEGFTTQQEIASPSQVWWEFGKNLIQGLHDGIIANEYLALEAVADLTSKMVAHAKELLESVTIAIQGSDGTAMTFRPVVDSSEMEKVSGITGSSGFGEAFVNMNTSLNNIQSIATGIQTDIQSVKSSIDTADANMKTRFETLTGRIDMLDRDINNMKIYLDTGALVGGTAQAMGRALGQNRFNKTGGR